MQIYQLLNVGNIICLYTVVLLCNKTSYFRRNRCLATDIIERYGSFLNLKLAQSWNLLEFNTYIEYTGKFQANAPKYFSRYLRKICFLHLVHTGEKRI